MTDEYERTVGSVTSMSEPTDRPAKTLTVRRITADELESTGGKMPWLIVDADSEDLALYARSMLGAVPEGHFRYRCAVEDVQGYYARKGYGCRLPDYHYVCCACGEIAPADDFEALVRDEDTEQFRPARPGEYDPLLRCPHCRHLHTDDDSNPGICDGTYEACVAAREEQAEIFDGWLDGFEVVDRIALSLIGTCPDCYGLKDEPVKGCEQPFHSTTEEPRHA